MLLKSERLTRWADSRAEVINVRAQMIVNASARPMDVGAFDIKVKDGSPRRWHSTWARSVWLRPVAAVEIGRSRNWLRGRQGFKRHPENSKRELFRPRGLQSTTKIQREDAQEKKERELWREGKKARNFGAPTVRGAHPARPIFLGSVPHPSRPPTLRGPPRGPTLRRGPTLWGPAGPTLGGSPGGPDPEGPILRGPTLRRPPKGESWVPSPPPRPKKKCQCEGGPGLTFPNVKNDAGASTKAQKSPCFFLKASPAFGRRHFHKKKRGGRRGPRGVDLFGWV